MVLAALIADAESDASDDMELARRCSAGDRAAQQTLFQDYRARVHATLYRILGSNRDMEDLIQDSFLQVFRSIHSYRGDARLATWVSRVSARVAYAYLSKRKLATVALESAAEPIGNTDTERQIIARQATERLYQALDAIDPKQRIAFALHVIDGRPLKEVAEITDTSLTAVKTRIWRARKEMAKRARRDPLLAMYLRDKEMES